ncbi:MAG: hypothetical protein ACKVU2_05585 [Saprospiraceae bacterium]
MPTSNIPLTYACKLDGTVHLYIAVYAATSTPPAFPSQGTIADATIIFNVTAGSVGAIAHFKHYAFGINSLTDIEVHCSTHVSTILVADLDEVTTLPTQSGDQALEVPYGYTQIVDADHFKTELVIFSASAQKYDCTHSGPASAEGDTESAIFINSNASAVTEFSDSHEFTVPNVSNTTGAHEVSVVVGNPPRRKRRRIKNINHSPTPFPRRRRNRKP